MKLKMVRIDTLHQPFDGKITDIINLLETIIKDNPKYTNIFIETDYDGVYNIIGEMPEDTKEEKLTKAKAKDMELMEQLAKKHNCTIMFNEYQ